MIEKFKIFLLNYKIFGGRRWYQYFDFGNGISNRKYIDERAVYRTESFVKFLKNIEWDSDEEIVDVGCNAGRYCYEMSNNVRKATGIEFSRRFVRQAKFLRYLYEKKGLDLKNVKIVYGDVMKNLELFDNATTVILSKVLYHKNLNGAGEKILEGLSSNGVNRIIIQGHTTQGNMGEDKYIQDLLQKYNYSTQSIDQHEEYPIAIAIRKQPKEA